LEEKIAMINTRWALVALLSLAVLGASQGLAWGKGNGKGNGGAQKQGQWVNNQPHGWSGQGQKQGWEKHGTTMPVGMQKNLETKGKYPKGLEKTR
jgi:hypothetical protein